MAYNNNFRQGMGYGGGGIYPSGSGISSEVPPPLPPRNYSTPNYGQQSMYSNGFGSGYGYGGYGGNTGYGGYGAYGGYGSYGGLSSGFGGYGGYNSYGGYRPGFGGISPENRFIQLAEESARPAFESFGSVMGMLQSVTMMFDSTFHAVHASYASVLGVADNFSKLRSMFASVFSAFSAFKALNWIYRRILYLLGRQPLEEGIYENAWGAASSQGDAVANPSTETRQSSSGWYSMGLFSLVLAASYLIMKLISQLSPRPAAAVWNPMEQPGTRADVLYNFAASSQNELNIRRNQIIMIAPKSFQDPNSGWLLACDQSKKIGMVPANYIMTGTVQSTPLHTSSIYNTNVPPTTSIVNNIIPNVSPEPVTQVTEVTEKRLEEPALDSNIAKEPSTNSIVPAECQNVPTISSE